MRLWVERRVCCLRHRRRRMAFVLEAAWFGGDGTLELTVGGECGTARDHLLAEVTTPHDRRYIIGHPGEPGDVRLASRRDIRDEVARKTRIDGFSDTLAFIREGHICVLDPGEEAGEVADVLSHEGMHLTLAERIGTSASAWWDDIDGDYIPPDESDADALARETLELAEEDAKYRGGLAREVAEAQPRLVWRVSHDRGHGLRTLAIDLDEKGPSLLLTTTEHGDKRGEWFRLSPEEAQGLAEAALKYKDAKRGGR